MINAVVKPLLAKQCYTVLFTWALVHVVLHIHYSCS